jgi:pyridoxal phosphate enzyme (YggS family)
MKDDLGNNLMELRGRIAEACELHDRDADDVTIVAVTKTHPASTIQTAVAHGLHDIGESRIQEAELKITALGPIARFHLVGHLQTNKVRKAVALFDVIQSVDSFKLAEEISRRTEEAGRTIECLIEVNCSGEASKSGVSPDGALDLIRQVHGLPALQLIGLMTIGPLTDDTDQVREAFRTCRELFKRGEDIVGDNFDTLSMGMSDDFVEAIAEGSTMIRIGSALFGPREA